MRNGSFNFYKSQKIQVNVTCEKKYMSTIDMGKTSPTSWWVNCCTHSCVKLREVKGKFQGPRVKGNCQSGDQRHPSGYTDIPFVCI